MEHKNDDFDKILKKNNEEIKEIFKDSNRRCYCWLTTLILFILFIILVIIFILYAYFV